MATHTQGHWVWTVIAAIIGVLGGAFAFAATDRLAVGRILDTHESRIEVLEKQSLRYEQNQQAILQQLSGIQDKLNMNGLVITGIDQRQRMVLHRLGMGDLNK